MAKQGDFDFYCEVALKPNADINKVYESENVLAFHHTKPSYEKHVVVVPKKHVHDIKNLDGDTMQEILTVCQSILKSWDPKEIDLKGAKIVNNFGKFQDTPHVHFHVILGSSIRTLKV